MNLPMAILVVLDPMVAGLVVRVTMEVTVLEEVIMVVGMVVVEGKAMADMVGHLSLVAVMKEQVLHMGGVIVAVVDTIHMQDRLQVSKTDPLVG